MSYQEKNIAASLVSFTLILGFYLVRVLQMVQNGGLNTAELTRLWVTVIVLGIVVTIAGTILTHILSSVIDAIKTNGEPPKVEDIEDERDKLIYLKGSRVAYIVTSLGVFLSMLTFALGQPPLVMFTLLILIGIIGEIAGSVARLYHYRRGF